MAKTKEIPSVEQGWEIKDRTYFVKGKHKPLTLRIPSKHSRKFPMLWFDPETNKQKELRYATNMSSPFVEDQRTSSPSKTTFTVSPVKKYKIHRVQRCSRS
jgi:hypothetical protein